MGPDNDGHGGEHHDVGRERQCFQPFDRRPVKRPDRDHDHHRDQCRHRNDFDEIAHKHDHNQQQNSGNQS